MNNIRFLLDEDGIPIYKGDTVYLGSDYPFVVEGFCISQSRSLHDFSPLGDEYYSVKTNDGNTWPPNIIKHYYDCKFVEPKKKTEDGWSYKRKEPILQRFFWKNIRGRFRLLKHKIIKH